MQFMNEQQQQLQEACPIIAQVHGPLSTSVKRALPLASVGTLYQVLGACLVSFVLY